MTIEATEPKKITVNGDDSATVFSFSPMVVFEADDIFVVRVDSAGNETLLAEGTGANNYAVTVASYPGTGSITYPADEVTPLPTGESLVIKAVLALEQNVDLENQGGYHPETLETALDKLTKQNIQQQEEIERSLRLPLSSSASTTLPNASAGLALGWSNDGLSLVNLASPGSITVSTFAETYLDDTTAEATRDTLMGDATLGQISVGQTGGGQTLEGIDTILNRLLTTTGDFLRRNAGGVVRIPVGSANQGLVSNGTLPEYQWPFVQGQCFLELTGGNLVLSRKNGRFIVLKSSGVWQAFEIPSSGPTLSASGAGANTLYYIYAYDNSGTITLERSTTADALDTGTGFRIKTGDATRLLVGMAQTNGSSAWENSDQNQLVRTWYHDGGLSCVTDNDDGNDTITGTSYSEVDSDLRHNFLVWDGEEVFTNFHIQWQHSGLGNDFFAALGIDDATAEAEAHLQEQSKAATTPESNSMLIRVGGLTQGGHDFRFLSKTDSGTLTWLGSSDTVCYFRTWSTGHK